MLYKELHPRAKRVITDIDQHFGISLSKRECDVYRILSQCNRCDNLFIQFLYNEEEVEEYIVGDFIPGGQRYSG